MLKKLLFFLFIFFLTHSYAQDKRQHIFGKVSSDSIIVKDVHIFNKNSRKGTISNSYGEFQIPVKENDTLLISDIQYESQKVIITKVHLQNLQLSIYLKLKVNELSEVKIKEHDLTSNLTNDARNTKINSKISKVLTEQDAWKIDMRVVDDFDSIDLEKAPDTRKLTDPTEQASQANFTSLGRNLINELSKIGQKKRHQKREQQLYELESQAVPENIRNELGNSFFTKTLKIKPQYIKAFINHCKSRGIIETYLNGNKIEAIDILIKESKPFLKNLEDEK